MKNTLLFMGTLSNEKQELLQKISKAVWGGPIECCGAATNAKTLEFLPMNLEGPSPLFCLTSNLLHGGGVPNFKKVSGSKNNCRVAVILENGELPEQLCSEGNRPDFFLDIDTGKLSF